MIAQQIKGFVKLVPNPKNFTEGFTHNSFKNQICRFLDINEYGDVLVVSPNGLGQMMVDNTMYNQIFHCEMYGNVILPPFLPLWKRLEYLKMINLIPGGYSNQIRDKVVSDSLKKGVFDDSIIETKIKYSYENF